MQEVAGRLFADRTTLTVAHRLEAVIASDTVVVMEAGKVAETGPPATLLNDPTSWFTKLVEMAGPNEAASLRAAAKAHFEQEATIYHPEDDLDYPIQVRFELKHPSSSFMLLCHAGSPDLVIFQRVASQRSHTTWLLPRVTLAAALPTPPGRQLAPHFASAPNVLQAWT
jgi:ABC-type glutathione transport system ATPase component